MPYVIKPSPFIIFAVSPIM